MQIVMENLSFTYATGTPFAANALRDVNLCVGDGSFVGIMGHTGCGKTTLLQLIAGLLVPDAGRVLIDGEDINKKNYPMEELRRRLRILFQFPEYQLFETTVERDVAFGLQRSGLPEEEIKRKAYNAMTLAGLNADEVKNLSPMELSGGEKRKAAIAGVLVTEPRILLLDEPVAGLDPVTQDAFMRLLVKLHGDGVTIVMVSHSMDVLCEYAQRIIVMDGGGIVLDGTPREIFCDAEKLAGMGLEVCQPRRIAQLVKERGFDFPQNIVRYDELFAAIKDFGGAVT
jgi:energy-coupling factor transport system ATP-binding protein